MFFMYFKIIFICSFFHSNKMANHGFPFILIFVALTVRLILAMPYVESEVRLSILKLFFNEYAVYALTIKMTESQVDRKFCTYPQNDRKGLLDLNRIWYIFK